jgi:hypothetical protein
MNRRTFLTGAAVGCAAHTPGHSAKNVTAAAVHVEGDPDSPIDRGTFRPKVRRPGSNRSYREVTQNVDR